MGVSNPLSRAGTIPPFLTHASDVTRWPTLSDLSSHPLSGSSPSPLSACRNSSDLSPGPFPFSYYKYFLAASTQCHDFKHHLHTDDFYIPSLIRSSPLSNIWISNNFISITELPQKYLKLDKREKGRLGKCEQNGQRPWSAGRVRQKANWQKALRESLAIEIQGDTHPLRQGQDAMEKEQR